MFPAFRFQIGNAKLNPMPARYSDVSARSLLAKGPTLTAGRCSLRQDRNQFLKTVRDLACTRRLCLSDTYTQRQRAHTSGKRGLESFQPNFSQGYLPIRYRFSKRNPPRIFEGLSGRDRPARSLAERIPIRIVYNLAPASVVTFGFAHS